MPVCANPKETKTRITLYASRLGETLLRGESFFCFSEKDREWLTSRNHERPISRDHESLISGSRPRAEKVHLIRPWLPASIAPLRDGERTAIKNDFAQGREFFFADVSDTGKEGMLYLLKAFSIFKKRQLSNLQLLIAGDPAEEIKEKLETYKYRQDVHWCLVSDVRSGRVPAAAYAVLYLFGNDSPGSPVLEAWATGVPVLVTAGARLAEMAGDAALAAAAGDPTALAGHLMSIYKDEALRGRLIQRGFSRLPEFAVGETVDRVWAVINRVYEINK
jgi:glycosyltransferase involved in cell wall biosynthesis